MSNTGYRTRGIVLSGRPLGEKDRLMTLMTMDRGLLRVVARGVRGPRSKLAGLVMPFAEVNLDMWRGRSLDGIRGGEVLRAHRGLRERPERYGHASAVAEVTGFLAQEGEADPALYLLLLATLTLLATRDPDLILTFFLLRAIKVAGLFPDIGACVACAATETGGMIDFDTGSLTCHRCHPAGNSRYELCANGLRLALRLRDIHPRGLADCRADPAVIRGLRDLMFDYVEFHLGRSVNSRRFLDILN